MSEVKHTPGPWVLFDVGGDNGTRPAQCPAAEATKQSILTVTEEGGTTFAAVLKKGDALLIAAAPDLLAACLLGVEALDSLGLVGAVECKRIRAAIAKATGDAA